MLLFEVFVFGFTVWLGAYLISRNPSDIRLILAGTGLIVYGIALALGILAGYGDNQELNTQILRWQKLLLLLPAACWLMLLIQLLRGDESWYSRLQNHRNPFVIIITASIFFGLGLSMLIFPLEGVPRNLLLLGIGLDLFLLGAAIAFLDAFDEGETVFPHITSSFIYTLIIALIFGGQIAIVIILNTGVTTPMLMLLITVIIAAILLQSFSEPIRKLLDSFMLYKSPQLAQTQAIFRETAGNASRQGEYAELSKLDDQSFVRLTRRALSHMGDLPRLSTSPLTRLPIIDERVGNQGNALDTLQRATELRALLSESINRLKPEKDSPFGTTDQWRHFNALYYPYVVGIKPYSRRASDGNIDEDTKQALVWFRDQVPQRTLYNWQNGAASLVAQDLRERSWLAVQGSPHES